MKKHLYTLMALLLAAALLLTGCGGGGTASSTPDADNSTPVTGDNAATTTVAADSGEDTTTTAAAVTTTSTTADGTPVTTTSTTAKATTTAPQPSFPPVKAATYSARDALLDMLQEGEVPADAVWKPVYLDANCIDGFKEMYVNTESFSMKTLNYALPFVYVSPEMNGVVLNANQWASGGLYWDMAGLAFTSPGRCKATLRAGEHKTICAASDIDANALTKTEGRVEIYLNDELVWPTDKDFATVTAKAPLDFPTVELDLYPGDIVTIYAYGAKPGEDIKADTGGVWENHVWLDPVIDVKAN